MKYALNIAEDKRILSAWVILPNAIYEGMPIVEALPEGDISEYRYENGEFIHDPLPEPEQPENPEEPADLESRVSTLETNSTEMKLAIDALLGVAE